MTHHRWQAMVQQCFHQVIRPWLSDSGPTWTNAPAGVMGQARFLSKSVTMNLELVSSCFKTGSNYKYTV